MSLRKGTITNASQVMLPVYPVFFAWIALGLLFTPLATILGTPSFRVVHDWVPMRTCGLIMLGVAAAQMIALIIDRRLWYVLTLGVAFVVMAGWAVAFTYAAAKGVSPWTAPAWPAFVAAACVATSRSLNAGEV